MRDKQIIIFEGICGSGKTTTAKQLHEYLQENGINSRFYEEWETSHPINLAMHACITETEFNSLCEKYPLQSERLQQRAVYENNYVFVQYYYSEDPSYFDDELFEILKEKDFCFCAKPIVSPEVFTEILKKKWKKFSENYAVDNIETVIFDGSVFQHQIHDLQRLYNNIDKDNIINHINILHEQIARFNPIIIYFAQCDLNKNLKRISDERDNPGFYERSEYYQNRKQIEYEAMSRLKLKSYVIDNSDCDYDKAFKIIKAIIDI